MSKRELKVKSKGELGEIIQYLESIVSSMKEGTVVVQKSNSFITLKPKDEVTIEIEAEQKKNKETLAIELSWRTEELITEDPSSQLIISSTEPEVADTVADGSDVDENDTVL